VSSLDEILSKIHSGKKLKSEELKTITSLLEEIEFQEVGRKLSADDIYLLLSALARDEKNFSRELFERFFDFQDPTTASLVAKVLCSNREGRSEYLEKLINLALGSSWDPDGDVQQEAIELLGEFAREEGARDSARGRRVTQLLFELFEEGGKETKLWSYTALLSASGTHPEDLPSRYASLDFSLNSRQIDWERLKRIRR